MHRLKMQPYHAHGSVWLVAVVVAAAVAVGMVAAVMVEVVTAAVAAAAVMLGRSRARIDLAIVIQE